jgi:hypothetical protein
VNETGKNMGARLPFKTSDVFHQESGKAEAKLNLSNRACLMAFYGVTQVQHFH